jgi:transposase
VALESALTIYRSVQEEIGKIEEAALSQAKLAPEFEILQTMSGVGKILGMTIMFETGNIGRFAGPGDFASYSRCVKSVHTSNGKKKGEGNAKSGNKYLSWAFSEAAHFAVRYEPLAKRFHDKKKAQRNGIVAIRALAHKMCRAAYFMLRDQVPFDPRKLFAH